MQDADRAFTIGLSIGSLHVVYQCYSNYLVVVLPQLLSAHGRNAGPIHLVSHWGTFWFAYQHRPGALNLSRLGPTCSSIEPMSESQGVSQKFSASKHSAHRAAKSNFWRDCVGRQGQIHIEKVLPSRLLAPFRMPVTNQTCLCCLYPPCSYKCCANRRCGRCGQSKLKFEREVAW